MRQNQDLETPQDIATLQMENDLLTHEVRFLRAKLTEISELEARAVQAENDARYVVDRLSRSPLGHLLRRKAGWRTLEDRYARGEAVDGG